MQNHTIRYCFTMADDTQIIFKLVLDGDTLNLIENLPESSPAWTKLDFHQCPHCPLTVETHPHCPLAANLVNIVKSFDHLDSFEEIDLDIIMEDRNISKTTTAQKGIGSLMGLVIPTSGCPHTAFFKPMARFHLPLSNEEETIYRATSMYLLAQYFLQKDGKKADYDLKGLRKIYKNMQILNTAVAERLRAASRKDSTLNAIILLDMFAMSVPLIIDESLEDIKYLFSHYFKTEISKADSGKRLTGES